MTLISVSDGNSILFAAQSAPKPLGTPAFVETLNIQNNIFMSSKEATLHFQSVKLKGRFSDLELTQGTKEKLYLFTPLFLLNMYCV